MPKSDSRRKDDLNDQLKVATRAAHDINNHLVGILGYASILLQDQLVSSDEGIELVNRILDYTDKASAETQKILGIEEPDEIGDRKPTIVTERPRPVPPAALQGRKAVLVIDDEEVVRSVSEAILTRAGYEVFTAATGAEGISAFEVEKDSVGCILLDLSMPYMKGNLIFARLRAIDPDVRVFVMSGYSDKQATEQFNQQGIDGFIQKPFSPEMLLGAVG